MHLLDDGSAGSAIEPISADGPARAADPVDPTMDHLDALEAQSINIFREAFARLKKLALP
jgi:sulfate adenylyltransferase subunit 2